MKRARSSDDIDLAPQLKSHISQKEVDLGVQSQRLMQQVYDKTLNYLKQGAKIESPNPKYKFLDKWVERNDENQTRRHLKQMVLSKDLQLQSSENDMNKVPLIDMCDCGQIIDSINTPVCRFCTQPLCQECSAECISCKQIFCKQCSLTIYERDEQQVCLDCFSFVKH